MRFRLYCVWLFCSWAVVGCDNNPGERALDASVDSSLTDAARDSAVRDTGPEQFDAAMCPGIDPVYFGYIASARPSPDGTGFCCMAGPPSCNCQPMGAWVADRCACAAEMQGVCDLHPNDWIPFVDEHGCQRYMERGQTACCNCPLEDAGIQSDAGQTEDASLELDASANG